jgi:hypothetical protein
MPLRLHQGYVAFERDDDVIIVPYPSTATGANDDIKQEVASLRFNFRASVLFADSQANLTNLPGHVFIWGHGNRQRNVIASGDGLRVTASDIAAVLAGLRLPKGFARNVVIWSCFAGAPDGFAGTVLRHLRARGYHQLSVYGARHATGSMADFTPDHRYLRGLKVYTNGASHGGGVSGARVRGAPQIGGWHGVQSLAVEADMALASPGRSVEL